jgi:myo-inositol-1(or 4)-monophosphatase
MDLDSVQRIAIASAYRGGEVLRRHFGKLTQIRKKSAIDLVTQADTESEKAIIGVIHSRFPEHTILAEESGLSQGSQPGQWIIDPLDGTTNYAHGLSQFAISIAFALDGEVVVGVVFNPMAGELFSAVKGQGSQLNGRAIRVSNSAKVSESLLVTGFPYDLQNLFDPVLKRFARCLRAARGIRRLGAAALDLCSVAAGRFDAFWEQNLAPWDTAAGVLIANEAGAITTDFANAPYRLEKKEIVSTNGLLHEEMISLLRLEDFE